MSLAPRAPLVLTFVVVHDEPEWGLRAGDEIRVEPGAEEAVVLLRRVLAPNYGRLVLLEDEGVIRLAGVAPDPRAGAAGQPLRRTVVPCRPAEAPTSPAPRVLAFRRPRARE